MRRSNSPNFPHPILFLLERRKGFCKTDSAFLTLFRDADTFLRAYCVHSRQLAPQLSRQLPHQRWCSGGGGHCGKGQLSHCQRQMAAADRSVAAPHREKRHAGGARAGLRGCDGKATPRCPHRPLPERTRSDTPKLHPRAFPHRAPEHHLVSPYLLSPRTDTPASATSAGREGTGRGPTLPLPPPLSGTPGPGLWHARVAGRARQQRAGLRVRRDRA